TASAPYTVTVSNVTRDSDGAALTTNSANFNGFAVAPFTVTGAVALSQTSVEVTYSDDYETTSGQNAANYCIAIATAADCTTPALAVSAAVAGSTTKKVVLTTAAQLANVAYK